MQTSIDLNELRELFLGASEAETTSLIAIVLSSTLLVIVLLLVRRRALREEYTPIWMLLALMMMVVSLWPSLLRALTRAIGAWTPSSTLFFLGELFLVSLCLNYSIHLSRQSAQIKNLAQETAVLRARVEELERKRRATSSD